MTEGTPPTIDSSSIPAIGHPETEDAHHAINIARNFDNPDYITSDSIFVERSESVESSDKSYDSAEVRDSTVVTTDAMEPQSTSSSTSSSTMSTPNAKSNALMSHLELDTALLKDFLNRTAANKAKKRESIAKQTSISHRRDSGAVRQALASPRQPLEEKSPNSPSVTTALNQPPGDLAVSPLAKIASSSLGKSAASKGTTGDATQVKEKDRLKPGNRRSTRTRTRPANPLTPCSSTMGAHPPPCVIPVRRTDGSEPVILKKTEAQELAILTRKNTRNNKGNAVVVHARILQLGVEMAQPPSAEEIVERELNEGEKGVRWDPKLAHVVSNPGPRPIGVAMPAPPFSAIRPAPSALASQSKRKQDCSDSSVRQISPIPPAATITTGPATVPSSPVVAKKPVSHLPPPPSKLPQTQRLRRLRGLGSANGTPARGLLATAEFLPTEVATQRETLDEKRRLATARRLKLPLPASESKEGSRFGVAKKIELGIAAPVAAEGLGTGLMRRGAKKRALAKA